MVRPSELDDPGPCPFLFPVVADRLWMRPIGLYCRRPGHPVRVPAASTLGGRCTAQYQQCDRYAAASASRQPEESGFERRR